LRRWVNSRSGRKAPAGKSVDIATAVALTQAKLAKVMELEGRNNSALR